MAGTTPGPESIRRNTLFALGIKIVGAVFTGGLMLFLVRYLGPSGYGVLALGLSIIGLLAQPADLGISRAAARFIAERRQNPAGAAAVLKQSVALKALSAGLISVVLFATAGPIAAAYDAPSLEGPLRLLAVALLGQGFVTMFLLAFEALGRNSLAFRLAFSESAIEVSVSVGLVLAGAGVTGAAAGRAVGYACGCLLGVILAARALGLSRMREAARSDLSMSVVAKYAGALFVIDVAFVAFAEIDMLLIGALLDPRDVGLFSAPVQILIVTGFAGVALAAGVGPRLARGRDQEPDVGALQLGLRLIVIFQFALVPPIVVWATPITDLLFGPEYAESAEVLRAFGLYVALRGPTPLLALGINYLGEARRRVPLAIAAVAINAAIDLILIPKIGIVAGAVGTGVAFLVFLVGHLMIIRDLVPLHFRPLAKTATRSLLAAGAMAAILFAFGTSTLSPLAAVAGGALGLLAYVVVLAATRELSLADLREARAVLR